MKSFSYQSEPMSAGDQVREKNEEQTPSTVPVTPPATPLSESTYVYDLAKARKKARVRANEAVRIRMQANLNKDMERTISENLNRVKEIGTELDNKLKDVGVKRKLEFVDEGEQFGKNAAKPVVIDLTGGEDKGAARARQVDITSYVQPPKKKLKLEASEEELPSSIDPMDESESSSDESSSVDISKGVDESVFKVFPANHSYQSIPVSGRGSHLVVQVQSNDFSITYPLDAMVGLGDLQQKLCEFIASVWKPKCVTGKCYHQLNTRKFRQCYCLEAQVIDLQSKMYKKK